MTAPRLAGLATPVGPLRLEATDAGLARVDFAPGPPRADRGMAPFVRALEDYFAGERRAFADLPLDLSSGTPFERRVWTELLRVPYGATVTYGELASRLGDPKATRAVGRANGANRLPVVVPCHRVVPAAGGVGHYSGPPGAKAALLALERRAPRQARLVL